METKFLVVPFFLTAWNDFIEIPCNHPRGIDGIRYVIELILNQFTNSGQGASIDGSENTSIHVTRDETSDSLNRFREDMAIKIAVIPQKPNTPRKTNSLFNDVIIEPKFLNDPRSLLPTNSRF